MKSPEDQPAAPQPEPPETTAGSSGDSSPEQPSPPEDRDAGTQADPEPPVAADQAAPDKPAGEQTAGSATQADPEPAAAPMPDRASPGETPTEQETPTGDEQADDEEPATGGRAGKKWGALILAAILLLAAAFGYRFIAQSGPGPGEGRDTAWRWNHLPFPPIDPRYGHASVWTGSKMIVWGGFSGVAAQSGLQGAGIRSDGAEFDPRAGEWVTVPIAPVSHRPDMPAVWTGTEMIAWGGDPAQPASGVAFNPESRSWRLLSPSPVPARGGQSVVWTGAEVIVWGGRVSPPDRPDQSDLSSAGAAYNPQTNAWRQIAAAPLGPRDGHAAVWTGKEMIIWGGIGPAGPLQAVRLRDAAGFDPVGNGWKTVPESPAALEGVAAWSGAEMLVWGDRTDRNVQSANPAAGQITAQPGRRTGYVMEGLAYNPQAGRWRRLPPPPFALRTDASAVWGADRFFVWGGLVRRNSGRVTAIGPARDGGAYDPGRNRWQPVGNAPVKGRDTGFSMVSTEDGLILWGGKASERGGAGTTLADGARLTSAGQ